jgi:hypothetical protein
VLINRLLENGENILKDCPNPKYKKTLEELKRMITNLNDNLVEEI